MANQATAQEGKVQTRSWYDRLTTKAETTLFAPYDEEPGKEEWRRDGVIPRLTPIKACLWGLWLASLVLIPFAIPAGIKVPTYASPAWVPWLTSYEILSASAVSLFAIHRAPIFIVQIVHKMPLGEWRHLQAQRYIDSIATQTGKVLSIERFDAPSRLFFEEFLFLTGFFYAIFTLDEANKANYVIIWMMLVLSVVLAIFHSYLLSNYIFGFFALTESKFIIQTGMTFKNTRCINLTDITEVRLISSYGPKSPTLSRLSVKTDETNYISGYSLFHRGDRISALLRAQIAEARQKAGLQPLDVRWKYDTERRIESILND